MSRLLELRQNIHLRQRKLAFTAAIVSCLVVAVTLIAIARHRVLEQPPTANLAVISQAVDLWDAATIRGEQPGPLQSVSLPERLVRVTIILPRFSAPGQYAIAVTHDQNGNGVVAQNSALAVSSGDKETVSLDLDLRKAKPGQYFLATTHEQDQAAYYYPLQIR